MDQLAPRAQGIAGLGGGIGGKQAGNSPAVIRTNDKMPLPEKLAEKWFDFLWEYLNSPRLSAFSIQQARDQLLTNMPSSLKDNRPSRGSSGSSCAPR